MESAFGINHWVGTAFVGVFIFIVAAVSYTHLDVYKRQLLLLLPEDLLEHRTNI